MTAIGSVGQRHALVVATNAYRDPTLNGLRSPGHDAVALAAVLGERAIGGFTVRTVLDRGEREIRVAVGDLLNDRHADDVVLVYLSCHGLLSDHRELYFAAVDTWKARLAATAISSQWLTGQLDACRARRQVLILDCCFSGGFASNTDATRDLRLERLFADRGRGRVVLTASRSTEYSFEGDPVGPGTIAASVFTAALVEGVNSAAADGDGDGIISVDDAFEYARRVLVEREAPQRPTRWVFGGEDPVLLARTPRRPLLALPAGRPPERTGPPALASPAPPVRVRPGSAWVVLGLALAVVLAVIVVNTAIALTRMR